MIKIKEAIIVEGRYDRIKLGGLFDTAIIETGGFRIFKDDEKKNIIRQLAKKRGIIILTDSDGAGFGNNRQCRSCKRRSRTRAGEQPKNAQRNYKA